MHICFVIHNSERPVDALVVKKGESLTDNFKSRDANASKNTLCRRSGLNPSSLVSGIFFHEPSSVSLRCRKMIVPLIFV